MRVATLVLLLWIALTPSANAADTQATRLQASRALASADIATRRAAAGQLGEVGRMADVAALVKALRDRDDETRIIAEAAIWEIWGRSGDAEIDTLYQKGLQLMNFGAAGEAIQIFAHQFVDKMLAVLDIGLVLVPGCLELLAGTRHLRFEGFLPARSVGELMIVIGVGEPPGVLGIKHAGFVGAGDGRSLVRFS